MRYGEVPGIDKEPNVPYFVQLPPEYDPYRRYPTIVTLNGAGTTPPSPRKRRTGRATISPPTPTFRTIP